MQRSVLVGADDGVMVERNTEAVRQSPDSHRLDVMQLSLELETMVHTKVHNHYLLGPSLD